jgi:hypothetical protein
MKRERAGSEQREWGERYIRLRTVFSRAVRSFDEQLEQPFSTWAILIDPSAGVARLSVHRLIFQLLR